MTNLENFAGGGAEMDALQMVRKVCPAERLADVLPIVKTFLSRFWFEFEVEHPPISRTEAKEICQLPLVPNLLDYSDYIAEFFASERSRYSLSEFVRAVNRGDFEPHD